MAPFYRTGLVLASLLFLGACAGSSRGPDTVASTVAEGASDQDQMTCKKTQRTGTRISSKICKTNRQWEQGARDAREATEQIQRNATHTGSEGG